MAYIGLDSGKWGSGPQIPISFYYDYQRDGTSMQYKVKIVLGAISGSSYFGYPIYIDLSLDGTKKVAQYTAKSASPSQWSSAITYESGWLTVANKTEGTTALTIRLYSGSGSSRDTSYKYNLAVSPAATTPTFSATTVTMGETVTINLPSASSSYTHYIAYTFGSITNGIIAKGVTGSATWTPQAWLSKQIPNATSGACTITVQTYSGNTYIGSKTATITLVVPDNIVPTIQSVTPTEAVEGLADKFGCYVQGKSQLSVSIEASDTYDAEIKSYVTTFDGATYNGSSFTTNTISGSGSLSMVTTVTDARGRTATLSQTIEVVAYTPPQITAMSAYRVDASGNEDDDGERIAINVSYSVASVNSKNTRLYMVRYKASGGSYKDITETAQTAETSYSGTLTYTSSPVISGDSAWVVQFELSDYFSTISVTSEIPTAYTIMDFGKSGKGVAFGKVSAKDGLEFAMDADFSGSVYLSALEDAVGGLLTVTDDGKVNKRTVDEIRDDISVYKKADINNWLPKILYGVAEVSYSGSAVKTTRVAFSSATNYTQVGDFDTVPMVVCQQVFDEINTCVLTENVSAAEFDIGVPIISGVSGTKTREVMWMAIGSGAWSSASDGDSGTVDASELSKYRLIADSYSKVEINSLLNAYRTITDSYSKTEVDTLVASAGKVKTVNGVEPDSDGNITISSGSGADTLVVTVTGDSGSGFTADKTFAEIKAAYPSVILVWDNSVYTNSALLDATVYFYDNTQMIQKNALTLNHFVIHSDNTVTKTQVYSTWYTKSEVDKLIAGYVKTVNGVEPDSSGNVAISTGSGGTTTIINNVSYGTATMG